MVNYLTVSPLMDGQNTIPKRHIFNGSKSSVTMLLSQSASADQTTESEQWFTLNGVRMMIINETPSLRK